VTVTIEDYGNIESCPCPFYEDLYALLEAKGYTRNLDIRVAGYDWRLTPDMGGFLYVSAGNGRFTGFNINDGSYPVDPLSAKVSALMFQSHPATYMSISDPAVFKNQEVVVQTGSAIYTPQHYRKLFTARTDAKVSN
jgi:hypothetical protein